MTKVICISDTHNYNIADMLKGMSADILIHAGDFSNSGTIKEIAAFNEQLGKVKRQFKHLVVISGNHDKGMVYTSTCCMITNAIYLNNSMIILDGLKIYGSPIIPKINGYWAFEKNRGAEIRKCWEDIPEGLDILITHGPPYGILDQSIYNNGNLSENYGCWDLNNILHTMKDPPKYHIFGHIHSAHNSFHGKKTKFYNVSICNEEYDNAYYPTEIEI